MGEKEKRCIFCQRSTKLTSEHIFGKWVQDYVPRTVNKHHFANVLVPKPGEDAPPVVSIRAGDPLNSQVPVVCGKCNSEWMSQLQERAKPFLIPLFEGKTSVLHDAGQIAIAAWAAMATMTSEHIAREPERITVTQAERNGLMKDGRPPLTWRIWIGRVPLGTWRSQWVRVTLPILDSEEFPDGVAAYGRSPNMQTTAFKIGKFYVFAMSGAFPRITRGWDWRTAPRAVGRLQQIWPITRHFLTWPSADMTVADAESFATAFKRYSDSLAARVGYR